jgi:hypothetical protein
MAEERLLLGREDLVVLRHLDVSTTCLSAAPDGLGWCVGLSWQGPFFMGGVDNGRRLKPDRTFSRSESIPWGLCPGLGSQRTGLICAANELCARQCSSNAGSLLAKISRGPHHIVRLSASLSIPPSSARYFAASNPR